MNIFNGADCYRPRVSGCTVKQRYMSRDEVIFLLRPSLVPIAEQ